MMGRQEKNRACEKVFIPFANEHLRGFVGGNKDLMAFSTMQRPASTTSLGMDAALVTTGKAATLFCYKGYKSYQSLNTCWAEQEIILNTEFRDGNGLRRGTDSCNIMH
jgi:hypothetical protein